jgi:RNA polymerase sigma-70 factor (ECF subfamily)
MVSRQPKGDIDEVALMQAARDDPAYFEPLYGVYFSRINAYCLGRVGSPQEAEDLTSLIFTQVLHGLRGYRGGSVAAWLFRIARNTLADFYHEQSRAPVSLDGAALDIIDDSDPPLDRVIQAEQQQTLRELVTELTDDERELTRSRSTPG